MVGGEASAVTFSKPPCEESARSEDSYITGKMDRGDYEKHIFFAISHFYANYVAFSIFLCNFANHGREKGKMKRICDFISRYMGVIVLLDSRSFAIVAHKFCMGRYGLYQSFAGIGDVWYGPDTQSQ